MLAPFVIVTHAMENTMQEISTGTYKAETYSHYYKLTLNKDSKIFLSATHNSGSSAVLDSNLNNVAKLSEREPLFLKAGEYTVRADYSSPTYGVLASYIPSEGAYNALASLGSTSYKATTYNHFYKLSLSQDSSLMLNVMHNSGYSAVYDKNLNLVTTLSNSGPLTLEAGEYVVHASYSSPKYAVIESYIASDSAYDLLPSLETGSYRSASYNQYYKVSLDQDSKLMLNVANNSGYSAIYDKNLDLVTKLSSNEPISLAAGEYVMHASYSSPSTAVLDAYITPAPLENAPGPVVQDAALDTTLIELYVSYFNRAPEAEGLLHWRNTLDSKIQSGMTLQSALDSVAEDFWIISSSMYSSLTGYTDSMSSPDFVGKIYANVLGRPDALENDIDGIMYWSGELDKGAVQGKGQLVNKIIQAAHHYIDSNPDDTISIRVDSYLNNRIETGRFFSQKHISGSLSGEQAIIGGYNIMAQITSDARSVETAKQHMVAGTFSTTDLVLSGTVYDSASDYGLIG